MKLVIIVATFHLLPFLLSTIVAKELFMEKWLLGTFLMIKYNGPLQFFIHSLTLFIYIELVIENSCIFYNFILYL